MLRDLALAEELAQDALVAALERWPEAGIPDNPGAWLMQTAKHRAIDQLRRGKLLEKKHAELGHELEQRELRVPDLEGAIDEDVGDDLLRLMLSTCHPVLPTEARTALFKQLLQKFKKMTDAGQLRIELRDGRMILQLPNDVLFDSGQAVVKPDGQRAIGQVAGVLKTLTGRKFQVAGHTDNVPIDRAKFASNWELSTARAVAVVHILVSQGVANEALSAAGYGEYAPLIANDTAEHKAKNRRIEISLVPAMDELVNLPDVK